MAIQRVVSKWSKTHVLLQHDELKTYVPATARFDEASLRSMLSTYQMAYAKPDRGTFGIGVIRVEQVGAADTDSPYKFQAGEKIHSFRTFEAMAAALTGKIGRKGYLLQQGIELLRHSGRRFDLRIMVQKNAARQWETTGIIGRLASPRKIVTNYHSGGTPLPFATLMSGHMDGQEQDAYLKRLATLGVAVAKQLQTHYPRLQEIGIDIAVDKEHQPWILEVNTKPDPFIFRKLDDPLVFRRMYRYAQLYGRFKRTRKKRLRRSR